MPDEFPDPQKIWQNQPREAMQMSLEEIRRKARELQTKGRLATLGWTAIGLVLAGAFLYGFAMTHDLALRLGLGALSVWAYTAPIKRIAGCGPGV
jgi:hypothetical protein